MGGAIPAEERTPFAGRTLADALEQLETAGLAILYGSDLVRPDMRVLAEPTSTWPREILDEILAEHRLRSQAGPAGTLLVVPAPPPGSIRGVVVLAGKREPLAGVRVSLAGTSTTTATDRDGKFGIEPVPEGRHVLVFDLKGFVPQRLADVQVRPGVATGVRFELEPRGRWSEAVVVHGDEPPPRGGGPELRDTLHGQELRASPDLDTDPLRAVERLPGISEADGRGALHVRGGAVDEMSIMLDGLELYRPFHLLDRGGLVSAIDSRNLAAVELLAGAFPAEYGGSMSGVVEMDTIPPVGRTHAELAYTTNDARLAGQGRFGDGNGQWLVAARRGDPTALLDALDTDPNYEPRYADVFAKAGATLGRTTVSLNLLHSFDELEGGDRTTVQTTHDPGTFRSEYRSAYGWVTLENVWSPRWTTRTVVSLSQLDSDRAGSSPELALVEDQRSAALVGLTHQAWLESGRHVVKWGAALQHADAAYRYLSTPASSGTLASSGIEPRDLELRPTGRSLGAYVADRIELTRALRVELGMRWDEHSYVPGDGSLAPRVNFELAWGDRTTLRAGWGYFDQAPKIHELMVQDGVEEYFPAQRAEHRLLGIERTLSGSSAISVVAYQKLVDDPAPRFENVFDPGGFFPEGDPDRERIDPTRGRADGLEIQAHGRAWARLGWRASYVLSRAEDEIGQTWVPRNWDQRHAVDFGLAWSPAERWDLSLAGIYHSGQPTTPVTSAVTALADGSIAPVTGPRNSARLADYLRFNARIGRRFVFHGTTLATFLNVTNVLDRQNECCLERVRLGTADGATTVEPVVRNGLPRLFTAGLSWTF